MSAIKRLRVELGERGYDILVGPGLIGHAGAEILPLLRRRQVVIVTDETVARISDALRASLAEHGIAERAVVLPPGEGTKDLAHFGRLVDDILAGGVERGTMLVALGGGWSATLPGSPRRPSYAASISCRSRRPSWRRSTARRRQDRDHTAAGRPARRLLPAALVLADTPALRHCRAASARRLRRDRQIRADPRRRILPVARNGGRGGLRSRTGRADARVMVSCRMKAAIVAADERETGDDRALLNFGHTFGHALEAETGFGDRLLHGEAVASAWSSLRFRRAPRPRLGQDSTESGATWPRGFANRALGDRLSGSTADRLLRIW